MLLVWRTNRYSRISPIFPANTTSQYCYSICNFYQHGRRYFLFFFSPLLDTRELIQKVNNVGLDDMERIGERYIVPLFDADRSLTAILCDQSNVEEIVDGFGK